MAPDSDPGPLPEREVTWPLTGDLWLARRLALTVRSGDRDRFGQRPWAVDISSQGYGSLICQQLPC